jgi:hypothetical protein
VVVSTPPPPPPGHSSTSLKAKTRFTMRRTGAFLLLLSLSLCLLPSLWEATKEGGKGGGGGGGVRNHNLTLVCLPFPPLPPLSRRTRKHTHTQAPTDAGNAVQRAVQAASGAERGCNLGSSLRACRPARPPSALPFSKKKKRGGGGGGSGAQTLSLPSVSMTPCLPLIRAPSRPFASIWTSSKERRIRMTVCLRLISPPPPSNRPEQG